MNRGSGMAVYHGIAMGQAYVYRKKRTVFQELRESPDREQEKLAKALEIAKEQLTSLISQARNTLGDEDAAIIEVQLQMLDDSEFLEAIASAISCGKSAAQSVMECAEEFAEIFSGLESEYMQARAADIRDISGRIYDILCNTQDVHLPEGNFLLVAEDLAPSETIQLPRDRILALVIQKGSSSSHTAILARTLNIPSLVRADISLDAVEKCKMLAIDGYAGEWFVDPDEETLSRLNALSRAYQEENSELELYRGRKSVSRTGKKISLCANIGCPEDAYFAAKCDAEGVGLMRSEFLYLGRTSLPTEEELFTAYRQVAQIMGNKPVIIRTLDIGADKQVDYLNLEAEENPALGLRGIRICLTQKSIFLPQLRAIYRASAYGNIRVMFPMITSVWELEQAKELCFQVREQLCQEGIAFREIPIGVMIETPAAAVMAEELAKIADFFSVGTNDLTQYTLAIDRQNAKLGAFYDPYHPALLALLAHIAKCANDAGIWAGICGELGSDSLMVKAFLQMGYTELSMAPGKILGIRKIVCESAE